MQFASVPLEIPEGANLIFGQSHFIKTVEDLFEAMVNSVPKARFGIAFCEASGPCLVRVEGNDAELKEIATRNALAVGAGHSFFIVMKDAFPINVLGRVRECPEVVNVFCATANPVEVVVADLGGQRAVLGVADGSPPKGVEQEADVKKRKEFLRAIGYKL